MSVVADYDNDRIQIFNSQGQFVRKFGFYGKRNDQMNGPVGVGLLSNGNIVVSDEGGHRLQIFDFEGNFVRIVGAGQVHCPQQLFVDSDDNILVADYSNDRIQVFYQSGDHIKCIGTGRLLNPLGVCMDPEGRVLVSESVGRIFIFSLVSPQRRGMFQSFSFLLPLVQRK